MDIVNSLDHYNNRLPYAGAGALYAATHIRKLRMLSEGRLTRPIDIIDLVVHGLPWVLLVLKALSSLKRGG